MAEEFNPDRRVKLLVRGADSENDLGEPEENWVWTHTVWAAKTDVSDAERAQAQAAGEIRTSRFVVRSTVATRALKAQDRLECDGIAYDITGRKEIGRRDRIELTAAASRTA